MNPTDFNDLLIKIYKIYILNPYNFNIMRILSIPIIYINILLKIN